MGLSRAEGSNLELDEAEGKEEGTRGCQPGLLPLTSSFPVVPAGYQRAGVSETPTTSLIGP